MNRRVGRENGFTLIELTVVMLLITLLASVAVRETSELAFQTRYEQTKERLEMIKQAILGSPRQIINGQQAISGFVADMGRLPMNVRELIDQTYCAVDRSIDETKFDNTKYATAEDNCNAIAAGAWTVLASPQTDQTTGLMSGWRGPYLSVSGNVTDADLFTDGWGRETQGYCATSFTSLQTACPDAAGGDWINATPDHNYGWYFNQLPVYPDTLSIMSYGKDHAVGGNNYDADYPNSLARQTISNRDWLVDISNGISVAFLKLDKLLPISFCSDLVNTTKATCTSTWYGGCDLAGYYNKSSCEAATPTAGTWTATGYGEGFGCSDQTKTNQQTCVAPATWRSCTDNGTITTQLACSAASQLWLGSDLYQVSSVLVSATPPNFPVCMKIFYRKVDATIGALVSDENTTTAKHEPKSLNADGSSQTIRFVNFRDRDSGLLVTDIPIGSNAIAVYQYDGIDCASSTVFYPINHSMPMQVDFRPHTTLPVINW